MLEIPTMLTIQETSDRSGIPYERIRQWCMQDKINYKRAGKRKRLVNWEKFLEYLNEPDTQGTHQEQNNR